jgi:hypothetical protein
MAAIAPLIGSITPPGAMPTAKDGLPQPVAVPGAGLLIVAQILLSNWKLHPCRLRTLTGHSMLSEDTTNYDQERVLR